MSTNPLPQPTLPNPAPTQPQAVTPPTTSAPTLPPPSTLVTKNVMNPAPPPTMGVPKAPPAAAQMTAPQVGAQPAAAAPKPGSLPLANPAMMGGQPPRPGVPAAPPLASSKAGLAGPVVTNPGMMAGARPAGAVPPPPPPRPATAPAAPSQPAAASAGGRRLPFKMIGIVVAVLAVLGVVGYFAFSMLGGGTTPVATEPTDTNTPRGGTQTPAAQSANLVYWGLWEPSEVMQQVFDDFEQANPGIKVTYQKQSHKDYRERLQSAVANGTGPDLFRYHASWVPMLKEELAPMPSNVMSASEYQNTFYPVAYQQLQVNGQVVGIPLMYDGLALFYNKEVLRDANAQPPQTWAELKLLAQQLTVRSGTGIERAGLAIGNAANVEHFSDIIGLLILQNGGDPTNPSQKQVKEALQFYTNFARVDKVWDTTLPSSTVAFARGDVAMMLAPSWRVHEVLATNPNLDFGIVSVPKLGNDTIAWATYWAEGVNSKSKQKDAAWKLLKHLSSKEVMEQMFSQQADVRAFGELYSRKDMAELLGDDPYATAFLADAPVAQSWYLNSFTHDNGLNDQLIKYYQDAVNLLLSGETVEDATEGLQSGSAQVLRQYGVSTPAR